MIFQILYLAVGLILIVRPQLFAGISEGGRRRRLAALKAGAPEGFFEEKRTLETYPARRAGLGLWRLSGAVLVLSMLALLLLPL